MVQNYDKYRKFNPAAVARDAAKAAEGEGEAGRVETSKEEGKSKGQAAAENRARRADGIKAAQEAKEEETRPPKRKAEAEDGEVERTAADVESGEVVEGDVELGEEFDEVIENGRAVKVRRQE